MKSKDQTTVCKDQWQQAKEQQQAKTNETSTDKSITPFISQKKKSNLTSFDWDMLTWSIDKKDNKKGAPICGVDVGKTESIPANF